MNGTPLFQINRDDLCDLERIIPQWAERITMSPTATPEQRTQFRLVRDIITNIRWNYGPPENVEIIPANPESQ